MSNSVSPTGYLILKRAYLVEITLPIHMLHLCGVTSSPYEWCRETHHLVSGFTRIERFPPVGKPIAIKGTASEPTKPTEDWVSDAERSPKKKKEKKGSTQAKSSSTATLTSRKWNAVERASDAEGPVAKMARTS
ncbi:hypothetical protein PIB30_054448 [Stylosanthes scabra]|uniref:Uncharacterized protein n=1 Tax=Stylosanthes scabra TaxID=79078 RepID=A0ABU6SJW0_9FABA|nr:hypothetical protein [Stylosanthes scabra]